MQNALKTLESFEKFLTNLSYHHNFFDFVFSIELENGSKFEFIEQKQLKTLALQIGTAVFSSDSVFFKADNRKKQLKYWARVENQEIESGSRNFFMLYMGVPL